ncbi:sigma 54 modulation/S30EA ribosomal C-terminal domain-containing protein [Spirilliplanes yamanashiensis]|uniref:Sigma 54 modulation/S30EA ribosomal protein C-terminal domain-containing protein n=1 Tax=Spirilliplanes yamanashiensis TaxID=42233 RepID=A0A8J3YFE1_9ACTN|nr:sigma 54 modulation/S30EA ribosomal C-terminal domain-containing protein [Spirilliplanes yamanashiensis]MDP9818282.1 hypothetical protein [Spirilliplanes yamanashiensis]GIJ06700.1 hypothetical protein Sya03_60520 [Spirilliplanes yamanashiensis]
MRGFRHAGSTMRTGGTVDATEILVRGPVTTDDITRGPALIAAMVAGRPVTGLRLKMAEYRDVPAVAQVNVELAGRLVRGQATGASVRQAVQRVAASLPERLSRLEQRLAAAGPGRPSYAGERWERRACRVVSPAVRPLGGRRAVVRHKLVPPAVLERDAAAFTMDLRDYDFHLFVDAATGCDGVLYRAAPGYRLTLRGPAAPPVRTAAPIGVDAEPPPALTLAEAVRRLDLTGHPFVVFAGLAGGRTEVLYRRYDGHLGIVTPPS